MKKWYFIIVFFTFIIACGSKTDPVVPNTDDLTSISYQPTTFTIPNLSDISFPTMPIPADNPLTAEGIELGRRLFYDPILSKDSTQSCASCHKQRLAFTDGLQFSKGIDGIAGNRNAMSLVNLGYVNKGLFWDGRVKTLEQQALKPVEDPIEMHDIWQNVESKLRKHNDYPNRFRKAFGIGNKSEITKDLAVKAIAQFERILLSTNAKVDKIARRQADFTNDEYDGYAIYVGIGSYPDAQCLHCHNTPFYTGNDFFNNGLDSAATFNDFRDKGFGLTSGTASDNGKFRAPSLRNITLTAPYMHDGRFQTLEQVLDHYASGGHPADNRDPFLPQIKQINLTAIQKRQIIAYLKTLTDSTFINNPAYSSPF
jgi:cytochrome c peroxidase